MSKGIVLIKSDQDERVSPGNPVPLCSLIGVSAMWR